MEVLMYSLLLMAIVSNITVVNKVIVITIVLLFLQGEHRQKKNVRTTKSAYSALLAFNCPFRYGR